MNKRNIKKPVKSISEVWSKLYSLKNLGHHPPHWSHPEQTGWFSFTSLSPFIHSVSSFFPLSLKNGFRNREEAELEICPILA